jgi:hypothetical protein
MSKQKRKTVDRSKVNYPRPDRREPVDTLKEGLADFKETVKTKDGTMQRENRLKAVLDVLGDTELDSGFGRAETWAERIIDAIEASDRSDIPDTTDSAT